MPQEFHVLRCFECETFQVHIVKKSKKWDCKMCGAKQSLKKVYFSGPAKNCRLHVQSLNEQRIITESCQNYNNQINEEETEYNCENNIKLVDSEQSKWKEFVQNESDNSENELENCAMTFERQTKRRKYNKKEDNPNKNKKNSCVNQENVGKHSKWNNFLPEDNNEELHETDQDQEHEKIVLESTINKNITSKESKWNCFVTQENEEKLQESYVKPVQNEDNFLKQSKWDCFITTEHEDDKEEDNNFGSEGKANKSEEFINKSLFSQIQPADEDSLDFLNLD